MCSTVRYIFCYHILGPNPDLDWPTSQDPGPDLIDPQLWFLRSKSTFSSVRCWKYSPQCPLGYNEFDFFFENKEYRPFDGCKIEI